MNGWMLRAYAVAVIGSFVHGVTVSGTGCFAALVPSILVIVFWIASASSPFHSREGNDRHEILSNALIVVAVLVLVNESMNIGGRFAISGANSFTLMCFSTTRMAMLLVCVCWSCESLHVYNEGIFWHTLGRTTIEPGRHVGKSLIQRFSGGSPNVYLTDDIDGDGGNNDWAPFVGRGHVVGSLGLAEDGEYV